MTRFLVTAVLLYTHFLPAQAQAAPGRADLERVLAAGFEAPVRRASLEALGPGWEQLAERLARDSAARPLMRSRALYALAFSQAATTPQVLREVLQARGGSTVGTAVLELKAALGSLVSLEGERALSDAEPFLAHPVADVRIAAARSVASVGSPRALAVLREAEARESDPAVRAALRPASAVGR